MAETFTIAAAEIRRNRKPPPGRRRYRACHGYGMRMAGRTGDDRRGDARGAADGGCGAAAGPPIDPALLVAREHAWRARFGGDGVARSCCRRVHRHQLTDGPMASREATIAASGAFKDGGGRLLRLRFGNARAALGGYGRLRALRWRR
jgi:hypothetical protein